MRSRYRKTLRVLSATINITDGARGIKGCGTLRNFFNLQFVCRSEGGSCSRYLEISSSCLVYLRKKENIIFGSPVGL